MSKSTMHDRLRFREDVFLLISRSTDLSEWVNCESVLRYTVILAYRISASQIWQIIDAVKPARARFCYEMMGWALPDSVLNSLKLVKAVDRKAFGIHLDPCNLINSPERFYGNTALLNECFDKLGRWITSCHAKDLAWEVEMNVHFREVIPGKGALDYTTFLKRLAALPQNPPLMIEHLASAEEYAAAARHIVAIGEKAGISFGG